MDEEEMPSEDLDEEAVEPRVDVEDSQARIKYIQCLEPIKHEDEAEAEAVCEDRDGDWGSGIQPTTLTAQPQPTGEASYESNDGGWGLSLIHI